MEQTETTAPPPSGRRERKKAQTKKSIVDAASGLFWSKGYDATTISEIAEAADLAPGTLYLHFESKADIALVQFQQWMADFVAAIEARPAGEPPDRMLAATLLALSDAGYTSSQQLRDDGSRPLPSVIMGILFAETALEISGRVYQIMIETEQALAALFARRLEYPEGSLEPQIIASAFVAAWRIAVYGFANMVAAGVDPPAPDEIGTQAFDTYTKGLEHLWTRPHQTERHNSTWFFFLESHGPFIIRRWRCCWVSSSWASLSMASSVGTSRNSGPFSSWSSVRSTC